MSFLCIYHGSCMDGLAAAWVVKKWAEPKEVELIAAQYGDEAPDVAGKTVFVVDFSYSRETLIQMNEQADLLLVLDHHKSAEENLRDLDFCHFDSTKSGCIMAWEHFFSLREIPYILKYIQDRDLWQWRLPHSREISAALRSFRPEIDMFNVFSDDTSLDKLARDGQAILSYQQREIEMAVAREAELVEIGGYNVPCVNCTHLISEIGNELAKGYPFAAMYFDTVDKRVFSLRSDQNGIDVSKIAKIYGGGGHKNAAGFTIDKPRVL